MNLYLVRGEVAVFNFVSSVIARSDQRKRRGNLLIVGDCFASLAMTLLADKHTRLKTATLQINKGGF